MAERISRREFAKRSALIAAGAAAPATLLAQAKNAEIPPPEVAGDLAAVVKKLAKPLSKEAHELTVKALTNNRAAIRERYKFDLPENSEPCTVYHPARGRK